MVTGMGLGGILISMWSSDSESMLQRVSLEGERTEGKRPAVKRSEKKKMVAISTHTNFRVNKVKSVNLKKIKWKKFDLNFNKQN